MSNRFGTVPGLFEVPDSPTALLVAFGVLGNGFFFRGCLPLLEWWHPRWFTGFTGFWCCPVQDFFRRHGFDFPGRIWYVSVVAVAHVVG